MDRADVAYLINTTPKYFYLLEFHVGLLRRYAPTLQWDIWVATEEPEHPLCLALLEKGVRILRLDAADSGFLRSREMALLQLKELYTYVVPVQEDFILERTPDVAAITDALQIMDADPTVKSIRWMPCPGPNTLDEVYRGPWKLLNPKTDAYMFTFQVCIWRTADLFEWYSRLWSQFLTEYPSSMSDEERRIAEIRANYAENRQGQRYFASWMTSDEKKHLAWTRIYKHPNAVYMSPWPYRPTAVVGGKLEGWAIELAKREGFGETLKS